MNNKMKSHCNYCNKDVSTIEGYNGVKCVNCYSYVKPDNFFNKIILITVFLFILQLLLFGALASASPVDINPFSSNPANGSTVNNRIQNISFNFTSVNPVNTVIYNKNNTNFSIIDNSVVLFMNFDNRSSLNENGSFVYDLSQYGNNGTVISQSNLTWSSDGISYGTFNFTGRYTSIDTPLNMSRLNLNGFTISMWVRSNSITTTHTILGTVGGFILRENSDGIAFYANAGTSKTWSNIFDSVGSWKHIVFEFDSVNNLTYLWRNGVVMTVVGNNSQVDNIGGSSYLSIGKWTTQYFNGSIDDLIIYNRTLSQDEITNIYNTQITKFDTKNYSYKSINSIIGTNFNNYNLFINDTSGNFNNSILSIRLVSNFILNNNILGNLANYQYGTNSHGFYLTNDSNYNWYQDKYTNSKMSIVSVDLYESDWTNLSDGTFNLTGTHANTIREQVKWAYLNNYRVMFLGGPTMPTYLQNVTSFCNSLNSTCGPTNYTTYARLQLEAIRYYTNNGSYLSAVEGFSPYNEPNTKLLNNLNSNDINQSIRMQIYYNIYNNSRNILKANLTGIKVGGPSGNFGYGTDNVTNMHWDWWFGNLTNNMDFVDIHIYRDNFDLTTRFNLQLNGDFYGNCTFYDGNCSKIYVTEFNVYNDTVRLNPIYSNYYQAQLSSFYTNIANKPKNNITLLFYDFMGDKWAMLNGTDNTTIISYSLMSNVTRYIPASGTIYNSTIDNSEVQSVTSKYSSACNIILTNTINDYQNISVSFDTSLCGSQLIDTSNGNLISNGSTVVLDPYDVKYLTKPYYVVQPDETTKINNYLGEYITTLGSVSSDLQGEYACVSIVYQLSQYPVLIGLIGTVFLIGFVIIIIFGWQSLGNNTSINPTTVVAGFLTIVSIGVLLIVGLFIIDLLCSTGI